MWDLTKDQVLTDAKNKGFQIESVPSQWPFDYSGFEAFIVTNNEKKQAYICFNSDTGKLIAKNRVK